MTAYNEKIVKPLKMYYGDKEFTIGALGLDPMYEAILYRFIKCRRRNGVVEGITYEEIRSFTGIGAKKAHGIATALVKQGVEINDIPDVEGRNRVDLVVIWNANECMAQCTSCKDTITTTYDIMKYKFCPLCGKRLTKVLDI